MYLTKYKKNNIMFFARGEEEIVGQACEIPISSLIAASLLQKKVISDLELSRLMSAICSCGSEVYVSDGDDDPYFHCLSGYIIIGNNYFALKNDITLDTICGKKTVREVLEFVAGDFILDYVGYRKKKKILGSSVIQKKDSNSNVKIKRRSLFETKQITKVKVGA